jgi:DNA-binding GntR family transcriptional regulator
MSTASNKTFPQYQSLTEIILTSIRQRIVDGELIPGARLNIDELARNYHASQVPVRESLRKLEAEGLVEFRPNRGAKVRELSSDEVCELCLIRTPLEQLAATQAVKSWTNKSQLGRLGKTLDAMDKTGEAANWHKLHLGFHQQLCELSGLPRLIQLVDVLRGQMRPYSNIYLNDPGHIALAQKEHREMVDCLKNRDGGKMSRVVKEHLARPMHLVLKALASPSTGAKP